MTNHATFNATLRRRKMINIITLLMIASTVQAAELYDQQTGKYLGQLGGNPYATNPPVIRR